MHTGPGDDDQEDYTVGLMGEALETSPTGPRRCAASSGASIRLRRGSCARCWTRHCADGAPCFRIAARALLGYSDSAPVITTRRAAPGKGCGQATIATMTSATSTNPAAIIDDAPSDDLRGSAR